MNMKLKPNLNPKAIVAALRRAKSAIIGVALIAVVGYTAYVVNGAVNVQPTASATPPARITFDKATITAIKNLEVVSGQVPSTAIGKDNPFTR